MNSTLLNAIPNDWQELIKSFLQTDTWNNINNFLKTEKIEGKIIYPSFNNIFSALEITSVDQTKVVILGQDPYHGQSQAMGLSFSVPIGTKIPPSLRNIFRELMNDQLIEYPFSGDLTPWSKQGVLLLNSILTVEQKLPGSHAKIGWEYFTDNLIKRLSEESKHIVFLLWGNYAKSKKNLIDSEKHLILEAFHPSPLARDKFQGCKHFSKTNDYLKEHNLKPIEWKLD